MPPPTFPIRLLLLTIVAATGCASVPTEGLESADEAHRLLAALDADRAKMVRDDPDAGMEEWPVTDPRAMKLLDALGRAGQAWWCATGQPLAADEATDAFSRFMLDRWRGSEPPDPSSIDAGVRFSEVSRGRVAMKVRIASDCGPAERLWLLSEGICRRAREGRGGAEIIDAPGSPPTPLEIVPIPVDQSGATWVLLMGDQWRCISSWATQELRVIDWSDPARPIRAWDREDLVKTDLPRGVRRTPLGFCAHWAGASLPRSDSRLVVWCGEIAGGRVARVAPIALFPADFVEEWAEMPWEEARRLVSSGGDERARAVHEKLQRHVMEAVDRVTERSCLRDGIDETLVSMYRDHGRDRVTISVRGDAHDFQISSVGEAGGECGPERELPEAWRYKESIDPTRPETAW